MNDYAGLRDSQVPSPTLKPNAYGPLTAGEMFARTTELLRENFRLFFGIVAVVIGVEVVVGGVLGASGIWMQKNGTDTSPVAAAFLLAPLTLLGSILIYIFTQIIQGALFVATQAKLASLPTSIGGACKLAAEKVGRLIGISLLVGLRILGYLVVLEIAAGLLILIVGLAFRGKVLAPGNISYFLVRVGHGPISGAGILIVALLLALVAAFIAILFWLIIRYSLSIPAAMAENLSVTDAIRRSVRLTRGSKGRLFALFLISVCSWILIAAVTVPLQLIAGHVGHGQSGSAQATVLLLRLVVAAIRILFSWLVIAFVGVATALCYFDLRVRKEGFGAGTQVPGSGIVALPAESEVDPDVSGSDGPISGGTAEDIPSS